MSPDETDLDAEPSGNLGTFDLESMLSTSEIVLSSEAGPHPKRAPAGDAVLQPQGDHHPASVNGNGRGPHYPSQEQLDPPPAQEPAAEPPDPDRAATECGKCGRSISAPKSLAGKRIKCPTCGTPVIIPGGGPVAGADGTGLNRHEVRARLEAVVQGTLAVPAPKSAAPEPQQTLTNREFRKLVRSLTTEAGAPLTVAQLEAMEGAISRLVECRDTRAGQTLLEHLDRLPMVRRAQAIRALGDLRESAAFEPLLKLLPEQDEQMTPAVLAALGNLADPRSVTPLVAVAALLPAQRVRAIDALTGIGLPAVPALHALLQTPGEDLLRSAVVEALGRIKDSRSIPVLSKLAKDPDPALRRLVIEALGAFDQTSVLRPLAAALSDTEAAVRGAAAAALSRMPDKRLAPFLIRAIHDPDRDVRLLVVQALGKCGDEAALKVLRPLLTCRDSELELEACEAVARLGDHTAVPNLLQKLDVAARLNGDEQLATKLIDALRRLKDDRAVLPLINLLGHRSDRVRARAAEALGQIGDRTALGPLSDVFDRERSPLVMAAAARALGDLQDPGALSALNCALQQTVPVRIKAVIALGEIGGSEALQMAAERLRDPASQVRYQAAGVIGRSGKKEFIPQLEPLVTDTDDMVRRAALKALQELGDTRTDAELNKSQAKTSRFRRSQVSRESWSRRADALGRLFGLEPKRLAVVAGGGVAVVCLLGVLLWWRPFSGGAPVNAPRGRVNSLSFAGDGATLVAGRTFRLVEIWNTQTQDLQQTLAAIQGDHVAFDASGAKLLSCDGARSGLYDLQTGQTLAEESGIKALAVNLLATRAATQSTDGRIIVWNLESGKIDARLQFDRPDTTAFAVDGDGRQCAIGTTQGQVFVTDVVEQAVIRELQMPDKRAVQALAFDPAKTRLAIGTATGAILLAEVEGDKPPETFGEARGGKVSHLMFLDSVRLLAARGESLEVFDLSTGKSEAVTIDLATVDAVAVTPDGKQAAVGSVEEPAILVFDLTSRQQVAELDVK
jgi:HEAT repeat protein